MLAKLIVHAENREKAVEKMLDVLTESKIYGITTNLEYLKSLILTGDYKDGKLFTKMLEGFLPLELSSQMQRYIKINFKRRFPVQAFAWTLI